MTAIAPTTGADPAVCRADPPRRRGRPWLARPGTLPAIDGLRAIAALGVVVFHIYYFSALDVSRFGVLGVVLSSGALGVGLFIVLSGFCLYLPFAAGRAHRFRAGPFLVRRCRRLLPAYYASILLALPLTIGVGAWLGVRSTPSGVAWQVLTHVTLTHIYFPDTLYGINGVYWSLAVEWQLYLMLPVVIVAVRRFGLARTVAVMIAVSVAYVAVVRQMILGGQIPAQPVLIALITNQFPARWAEFALGMVAADLYASGRIGRLSVRWPGWSVVLSVVAVGALPAGVMGMQYAFGTLTMAPAFFLVVIAALVARGPLARAAAWRPLVVLGTMSYSVYLVHEPLVQCAASLASGPLFHSSPPVTLTVLIGLIPLVLAVAGLLFVAVERPTMMWGRASAARRDAVREANLMALPGPALP